MHARKKLSEKQSILDHMNSEELAANLFRITQTEAKLKREHVKGQNSANEVHKGIGKKVRDIIKEIGGTMPEDLPSAESVSKPKVRLKEQCGE